MIRRLHVLNAPEALPLAPGVLELSDQCSGTPLTPKRAQVRRQIEQRWGSHTLPGRITSIGLHRMRAETDEILSDLDAEPMPKTWGECQARGLGSITPCPYVRCRHHLAVEVVRRQTGGARGRPGLKVIFPEAEIDQLPGTCSLVIADRSLGSGLTLEEVGRHLNTTRERIRQIEAEALVKLRAPLSTAVENYNDHYDDLDELH